MTDFDEIYAMYAPQVFRVCMGYFNDPGQAKDITQETFIAVWQHLPSFRHQSQLGTWIFRIATNNCLRSIQRAKRVDTADLPLHLPEVKEDTQEEKLNLLYQCIAELNEAERIIISLTLEDLPQAEIATIVGLSNGNLRVKLHRIREKLSIKFKAHGRIE